MTAIYSSPLERAVETAEPIARIHKLSPMVDDKLGECRFGEWEGSSFRELEHLPQWQAFNEVRSLTRPPGGELMLDVQTRMIRQIHCLRDRHPGEMVAVVSHCDPLRSALAYYLGLPLDMMTRFELFPASVSIVQMGERARVVCINHTGAIPL